MKMLFISFVFWIFIIPSLIASFLILTALAAFVPELYFAVAWFLLAFSAGMVLCGPFWVIPFAPFARSRFSSSARSCCQINSTQEKNDEVSSNIEVRS
jgi:hypothetical protein